MTTLSSVQKYGNRKDWPSDAVYIGMPGKASRAYGIPDSEGQFGKPWEMLNHPRGWAAGYVEYLAKRLLVDQPFADAVKALDGKTILCYCTHKAKTRGVEVACHGRILREYIGMLNGRAPA